MYQTINDLELSVLICLSL